MSEIARWYVLHTYSGYENTVASAITKHVDNRNLHHLINEVKIPMEKVTEMTDKGPKEYERKTFPGYVLVKMILTDETWHILRNIRGVTGFVGSGNDAIPLSDEEIAALGVERNEVVTGYQPGDRIKIIDGGIHVQPGDSGGTGTGSGRIRRGGLNVLPLQNMNFTFES